ncbi:MAG: 5-oxoprolinase [Nitrospirae bacterium]|nr:5-oxoprolinase [Nitrospirota bacterium]
MLKSSKKWRFAVDRGGTFTDVVGLDPDGRYHSLKLLSSSPLYRDASIEGIKRILGYEGSPLPADRIEGIRFGTTVATNALLERKGGRVLLITTEGFADLLEIGYQDRPDIFSLCIKKQTRLYSQVLEIKERVSSEGKIITPLDPGHLEERLKGYTPQEIDSIAVVFMHSWINPAHEIEALKVLRRLGFRNIYLSHRSMNTIKIVTRGQSAVVDAYLGPVLQIYLEGILKEVGEIPVEFIVSSGGLRKPEQLTGKEMLLSGPAGGTVASGHVCSLMGKTGVIGFDMGGTSTDVSRYDKDFEIVHETRIANIELKTDMISINTVASGGGSIVEFDGQKLTVGPESAGAYPGPACYGFGGPITITDANLFTGRIVAGFMPKTFGPNRDSPVDPALSEQAFLRLTERINRETGSSLTAHEVALGALRIANEKMAMAIKDISVSRGFDVRRYALLCFGGAGGQHACQVAEILGISEIIVHPMAGVFSAFGIGLSRRSERSVKTLLKTTSSVTDTQLRQHFEELTRHALNVLGNPVSYTVKREIDLRPKGTESYITVPYYSLADSIKEFKGRYRAIYGFTPEGSTIEIVNLRVEVSEEEDFFVPYQPESTSNQRPEPVKYQKLYTLQGVFDCPVYRRQDLPAGFEGKGPMIVVEEHSTTVVEPGFSLTVTGDGCMIIKKIQREDRKEKSSRSKGADPILLEVFHNLFMAVATKMGHTLKNTAHSVNMKERLDFSCALFDALGNLVANAPHIPVHLGAMADTVKALLEEKGTDLKPGDIYVTNNPYRGGSHLPDVTVIAPGFREDGKPGFFVAARGHHADIGGITPGSMPPESRHIDEEGVLIDNLLILRDGQFFEESLKKVLTEHPHPARNLRERILDIKAQIAACLKGIEEVNSIAREYGWQTLSEYMAYIQENASYMVKKRLSEFLKGAREYEGSFEDFLDDGTRIALTVKILAGENPPDTIQAIFDFTGTHKEHKDDNLNAPLSVTRSAVLYVLRSLLEKDIPLNSGCLKPIKLIVPEGTIINPRYPVSVSSGNVETSQRIVDVVLGAMGVAAASQGTMNNLLFQVQKEPPYYETIGGGSGAMDGCPGASAVQVHMTNTRITDPEVLEVRHPGVRLKRFSIRRGSGGRGLYPGGDGIIREIEFLRPAVVSVISERRNYSPYGIKGGKEGLKGVNLIRKVSGKIKRLPHRFTLKLQAGDSLIIKTPGGGGYGKA